MAEVKLVGDLDGKTSFPFKAETIAGKVYVLRAETGHFSTQPPKEPWWKRFFNWLNGTIQ